ncbi:roadblock/LC7 domain-containing protein [Dactylosporangium sp. NPDC051484]|uniref:roadblock/LC7 domain-containing protein n=1 Tax=Dactylosporangium sp. NPDC051484 TaxID=3154942 RepID=UPI00344D6EC5
MMRTDVEPRTALFAELARLRQAVPAITGCLVASTDGLLIADDAPALAPEGIAALAAACLGVSQRIADSAGHEEFQEVLIGGSGGYTAMYMADHGAVLVLLARADANVGMLHHAARRSIAVISRVVAGAALSFAHALPEPVPW